ncbi:hypothetical protein E6P09_06890 [Haloferax mediterranei ATCC 33500]|uniref:DUF7312 domain-containing protein n=1 Tax=Haloferax mediterranei (strain ATCC 33500 / DSM 1411 / JCM 8866 / NBRC 14739 / NCIMB 2177 / R-4) TaxID=523841 RepID=I3R2N5_HALMT|nr:hypothetical protein [Haloferax mediterranei]AFK18495.1 hypothetical protein HFX_0772 [Haloferax mediterranei ATCC 33500]AHZ22125.1 hypothetical protein BM92_05380 [Haloferax mediterranei ATCC 33500]EMA02232.1 hypothetical protein C439_06615 [Haloferax mediterranei ATCC 33500]MDX5988584.1 hypothetical protein [Haloferax mediterranei ATCC 33500]QCQ74999.1 hypothetical protein E6P09_06890 [Haloferax mediterranei ATCC 33500]
MSRGPAPKDEADGEDEWRYDVDEVGPDGRDPVDASPTAEQLPIEPGSPRAENVVFVLLGVLFAVGLIVITVFPGGG